MICYSISIGYYFRYTRITSVHVLPILTKFICTALTRIVENLIAVRFRLVNTGRIEQLNLCTFRSLSSFNFARSSNLYLSYYIAPILLTNELASDCRRILVVPRPTYCRVTCDDEIATHSNSVSQRHRHQYAIHWYRHVLLQLFDQRCWTVWNYVINTRYCWCALTNFILTKCHSALLENNWWSDNW